jgi:predicted secreted hydrolase
VSGSSVQPRGASGRDARRSGSWRSGLALLLLLLSLPLAAAAQGFAGLGGQAEGFALPDRRPLVFPSDHGAHPEFRVEWWYLTANLLDPEGGERGLQWTLFRAALDPADPGAQVWMGHAALTGPEGHLTAERLARGGTGQAGVALPFAAGIDEWRLSGDPEAGMQVAAGGTGFAYELTLTAMGPLVLHGEAGYSVKTAGGQASRYYSQPFLAAEGWVETTAGRVAVTGAAWLDREWSSQPLAADQAGWDWFSLAFDSGEKLMGFRLRGADIFTSATWIGADGRAEALADGGFLAEPLEHGGVAGRELPLRWRVRVPGKGLEAEVSALYPGAWMPMLFPYWEGPVRVTGSHPGRGYLEMTGYE